MRFAALPNHEKRISTTANSAKGCRADAQSLPVFLCRRPQIAPVPGSSAIVKCLVSIVGGANILGIHCSVVGAGGGRPYGQVASDGIWIESLPTSTIS